MSPISKTMPSPSPVTIITPNLGSLSRGSPHSSSSRERPSLTHKTSETSAGTTISTLRKSSESSLVPTSSAPHGRHASVAHVAAVPDDNSNKSSKKEEEEADSANNHHQHHNSSSSTHHHSNSNSDSHSRSSSRSHSHRHGDQHRAKSTHRASIGTALTEQAAPRRCQSASRSHSEHRLCDTSEEKLDKRAISIVDKQKKSKSDSNNAKHHHEESHKNDADRSHSRHRGSTSRGGHSSSGSSSSKNEKDDYCFSLVDSPSSSKKKRVHGGKSGAAGEKKHEQTPEDQTERTAVSDDSSSEFDFVKTVTYESIQDELDHKPSYANGNSRPTTPPRDRSSSSSGLLAQPTVTFSSWANDSAVGWGNNSSSEFAKTHTMTVDDKQHWLETNPSLGEGAFPIPEFDNPRSELEEEEERGTASKDYCTSCRALQQEITQLRSNMSFTNNTGEEEKDEKQEKSSDNRASEQQRGLQLQQLQEQIKTMQATITKLEHENQDLQETCQMQEGKLTMLKAYIKEQVLPATTITKAEAPAALTQSSQGAPASSLFSSMFSSFAQATS